MNFKKCLKNTFIFFSFIFFFFFKQISAYEIFIYRPYKDKKPLSKEKKIFIHGEFFGQLQLPSTFPSYNDLSGEEDRWNYGFRNIVFLTDKTSLLAQLVTHDDGHRRTKFDWHFSLRQYFSDNLVLIIGHDSNHDSDYQSSYYTNRNYVGLGLPIENNQFYIEPFTWFFHHTNQRGHIDFSGNKLRQEYGLRIGTWLTEKISLNFQIFAQTEKIFSLGQSFLLDFIVRVKMFKEFELSFGLGLLEDIGESSLGNHNKFHKFTWGLAVPF